MAVEAKEHPFAESPPPQIYWDTSFVLSALLPDDSNHARCLNFCQSLQAAGTQIIYSQATLIECIIKCRRLAEEGRLPPTYRRMLMETLPGKTQDKGGLFSHRIGEWERTLTSFLRQFRDCWEVNITKSVMRRVFPLIRRYRLDTFDAIHLATMEQVACSDIASLDEDFQRVRDLGLWNDLIFG